MTDRVDKRYQVFREFLVGFVLDLNHLSEDGWSVLVEGQRDATALRRLGFSGRLMEISSTGGRGIAGSDVKKVVILTDLDREGAVLASRYVKRFSREGFRVSLKERLRLKKASHGVFLHVENLQRFARDEE
ncbi:MAG: hypothetical protein JRN08_02570 [Nitrososphaerota archaeon]|nr:hypothetical protein [Nitrososphaerota archaeon]